MSDEYFFGVTLNSTLKEFKWEPDELKENGTGDISLTPKGEHCLVLKQALLTGGTEGEVNVVEVETAGYKTQVKIPIAALVGGKTTHTTMDITLPDPPAILRLVEGSGPVHIAGVHSIQNEQFNDDDDDDEDDFLDEIDDEEDEEETVEADDAVKKGKDDKAGKKRANSGSGQAPSKKKKSGKEAA